jgi:hypothetical protein
MAASLFFLPFRPAFDVNSLVIPGAQLVFYLTGTTTKQAVYTTSALSTELSNPVIANSAGVFPDIYQDDSLTYRVDLLDAAGATLHSVDPYIPGQLGDLSVELIAARDAALAAQSAAETAETAAELAETNAELAEVNAEAARDIALAASIAGGNVYATKAEGLAAVAEGETFWSDEDGEPALYRDVAGVATLIDTMATMTTIEALGIPAALYGASSAASGATNLAAFEAAVDVAVARGGGIVIAPQGVCKINIKTWTDAASLAACIRLPANVGLHVPAGATVQMADNQITVAQTSVVILNGADTSVTGTGTIDGGSLAQTYSTYAQNGPSGVFLRSAAQCHRARVGAGAHGYLTIQNCFGNPVNGGGALGTEINDVSVVGVKSDNVGEGPQIERADRVEMRRIISLNTTSNMVGDGSELAACTNCTIEDIYAVGGPASGFDLFGCQKVRMNRVTAINCNIDIHDFSPVDPCEDVYADNLLVIFNTGGSGRSGILIDSVHATIVPKNINVRGRVINEGVGALSNGVAINQAQDVATYGGGPYNIDVNVTGTTVVGVTATRAPQLRMVAVLDDCLTGLAVETTGLPATDNTGWELNLAITNCTTDVSFNGTTPAGKATGSFSTVSGGAEGLNIFARNPSHLSTAADSIQALGYETIDFTGATLARLTPSPNGTRKTIYSAAGFSVPNAWDSGVYKGINSKVGPNAAPGDGSITVAAKGRLELMYSTSASRWLEI